MSSDAAIDDPAVLCVRVPVRGCSFAPVLHDLRAPVCVMFSPGCGRVPGLSAPEVGWHYVRVPLLRALLLPAWLLRVL